MDYERKGAELNVYRNVKVVDIVCFTISRNMFDIKLI